VNLSCFATSPFVDHSHYGRTLSSESSCLSITLSPGHLHEKSQIYIRLELPGVPGEVKFMTIVCRNCELIGSRNSSRCIRNSVHRFAGYCTTNHLCSEFQNGMLFLLSLRSRFALGCSRSDVTSSHFTEIGFTNWSMKTFQYLPDLRESYVGNVYD
jgi:hypothetical protein